MVFKHTKGNRIWLRVVVITATIVIIGGSGAIVMARRWYNQSLTPVSSESGETIVVTIVEGSSPSDIAELLLEKGLIRSIRGFETYVRGSGDSGKLKAGTFELSASMTTQEVVSVLVKGEEASTLFTIGPGLRLDQIKKRFLDAGFGVADTESAFEPTQYNDLAVMKYQTGRSLEGFIFPETFRIDSRSTPSVIVRRSLQELDAIVTDEMVNNISKQGISVRDAFILASIIEKEVAGSSDRKQVAQVFYSRLRQGMPLGADATYLYDAAVNDGLPFPENTSAYNTRKVNGLPPGPISNFNSTALEAVANPAQTDYLFYVTGDDGVNYFSRTDAEHQAAVAKYCKITCAVGYVPELE